ncbi:hypothetical protein BC628DRAFT_1398212 [Trametes gibbosa]|nr:hypothetical protein BC628DRAFT_1398212 [Trametes gibbosa]
MPMSTRQVSIVALSFALSATAQRTRGHRVARIAGGAIAGIVIGCVVLVLLLFVCCCLLFRRRRARNTGAAGGYGGSGRGRFGFGGRANGLAVQEAGYGNGVATQGGWNAGGQPAYGGAPQPGGFAAVCSPLVSHLHDLTPSISLLVLLPLHTPAPYKREI